MKNKTCSNISKQKILTILFVLTLPLFLTGCTLSDLPFIGQFFEGADPLTNVGKTSLGNAQLSVWGLWENSEVVNAQIDKFISANPGVTVNYDDRSIIKPLVDYKERVYLRATDSDGPDVMRVHVSWVPTLASSLNPMPENMMNVDEFTSTFYPVAKENLVVGNKIYGLPTYHDGLVLVYNKDHFEEISQTEAPTAWEEFRRLALKLSVRDEGGNLVRGGAAVGTSNNIDFFSDIVGLLFAQAGVRIPADLDTKAAQDALTFYTNFVNEDGVWSTDFPEASVAFSQEKVSMIFVPSWNLLDIVNNRPEMNIGIAPVPQADPDNPAAWATFWVDVVPLSSKNPKAAWAYIKFMAEEEQQRNVFSEASVYRPYGNSFSRISMAEELSANQFLQPVLRQAPYAKSNVLAARAGNRKQVELLSENVSRLLDKTKPTTAAEVLVTIKAELSR